MVKKEERMIMVKRRRRMIGRMKMVWRVLPKL